MKQVYLLTGRPGTGKTSLIKRIVSQVKGKAGGFYTEEIRSGGTREGFRLITLDGQQAVLAHIDIDSPYKVSKYGVDISGLERIGIPALFQAAEQGHLVVIDEIGKMELLSAAFKEAVSRLIESDARVLGTIMFNHNPWADAIKRQPQVELVTVTRDNRQQVLNALLLWLETTSSDSRH
jgi:nucleoside-triphosphatase